MDQSDSKADEKDHAQRRAAERMAPKQEMRQRSAQQKNKKGEDQWVAHGGSRCLRKPDHLAASPVTLGAGLILNRDRWGRQTANHQALDPTVIPVHGAGSSSHACMRLSGAAPQSLLVDRGRLPASAPEAIVSEKGRCKPRRLVLGVADRRAGRAPQGARYWQGSGPSRAGRLSRTSSTLTMSG